MRRGRTYDVASAAAWIDSGFKILDSAVVGHTTTVDFPATRNAVVGAFVRYAGILRTRKTVVAVRIDQTTIVDFLHDTCTLFAAINCARIVLGTIRVCRAASFDGRRDAAIVLAVVFGAGIAVVAIEVRVAARRDGLTNALAR